MRKKFQQFSLVAFGAALGVAASLHFSAVADRQVSSLQLPIDDLRLFSEVFGRIKSDYVEPVEDRKLLKEAINGMLTGLDPHSAFLDQEAYRDLQVGTQGEFGGLGIEVGTEDGFIKVVAPIEDTPAFRAGVLAGDLIIKLDEVSVKGISLSDAVKRMRGKPNTAVKLTVLRKGETKPLEFVVKRDVIRVKSVKARMLEPGYGLVRITQFQEPGARRGGYFDFDGESLERLYLASPMAISRVTSGFKMRFHPILKAWRAHTGVDYGAPTGTAVRTVGDGRVVYADWLRGFGNLLIVDHGQGYMSLYAYNDGLLRQVGESVRAGDPVAQVGTSGSAEESGLYFELRRDGKPFDPMRWVAQ